MGDRRVEVDSEHYRVVTNDGQRSFLYRSNPNGFLQGLGFDDLIEVADHHPDGTTTAYCPDESFGAIMRDDLRGPRK